MTETSAGGTASASRPVIDFHAHILVPEVYGVAAEHNIFSELPTDPGVTEDMRDQITAARRAGAARMSDLTDRLAKMDAMGVDIQVLTASLVHQGLEWADAQTSLRLARTTNDWIGNAVASRPDRLIGLGTLPLHMPSLAVAELDRCVRELGLRGVGISTTAGGLELGDPQLAPFWAKAEELGALVYIHPGGNRDRRFKRFHLWNSVGQAFEEAMAVASLIYDGVLERHPRLKICVSHGGGYMPYYMGRIDRNYVEKANTRVNMTQGRRSSICACFITTSVSTTGPCSPIWSRRSGPIASCSALIIRSVRSKPVEFVRETAAISRSQQDQIISTNAATLLGLPN